MVLETGIDNKPHEINLGMQFTRMVSEVDIDHNPTQMYS